MFTFLCVAFALEMSSVDIFIADRIYAWFGNTWGLRDAWFTSELIHDGGRTFVALMSIALVLALTISFWNKSLQGVRLGLWYLLVVTLSSGLLINLLKQITHVDCPWDLIRYGGEFPYVRNFAAHPGSFRSGACFPAGHASAGYSWFGLYYFAREYCPRWRAWMMTFVLSLGLLFGIGQQLRGAHFVSHDVWTMALCWLVATLLYYVFFIKGRRQVTAPLVDNETISPPTKSEVAADSF